MDHFKVRNRLEVATNVAVLLVALAVLSTFAINYFKQGPRVQHGLQSGSTLPALPNLSYTSSPRTLLIAMNTKCHYCNESVPFYKRLTTMSNATVTNTRIVAVFPNPDREVKDYVRQKQLTPETIGTMNLSAINVEGTPSIILVDSNGRIINFWIGKLSEAGAQQVLEAVRQSDS